MPNSRRKRPPIDLLEVDDVLAEIGPASITDIAHRMGEKPERMRNFFDKHSGRYDDLSSGRRGVKRKLRLRHGKDKRAITIGGQTFIHNAVKQEAKPMTVVNLPADEHDYAGAIIVDGELLIYPSTEDAPDLVFDAQTAHEQLRNAQTVTMPNDITLWSALVEKRARVPVLEPAQ